MGLSGWVSPATRTLVARMDSTRKRGTSHDNGVVSSYSPIETMAAAGIFYPIQRLEQLVRRKVDECLKPEGLTAGQFLALSLIDREVDRNTPRIFQLHAPPAGQAT